MEIHADSCTSEILMLFHWYMLLMVLRDHDPVGRWSPAYTINGMSDWRM